jgi:hypothetical protein
MGILRFFVVLAITAGFRGDGLIRFFIITITKSPSEAFSPATMDERGA